MRNRFGVRSVFYAVFIAVTFSFALPVGVAAESSTLLTGKAAMGDWTKDAPGVRRKITVRDLPPPSSNVLATCLALPDLQPTRGFRFRAVLKSTCMPAGFATHDFYSMRQMATSSSVRVAPIGLRCYAIPRATENQM